MHYPWPSSAVSEDDMAMLHAARERSVPRVPITKLLHRAIVATYGQENSKPQYDNKQVKPVLKAA
jgi:hypothetical protein